MTYKKIHEILYKKVEKDYGPPCDDFEINCRRCQKWYLMLDILRECVYEKDKK